jgi:hypothetical protein
MGREGSAPSWMGLPPVTFETGATRAEGKVQGVNASAGEVAVHPGASNVDATPPSVYLKDYFKREAKSYGNKRHIRYEDFLPIFVNTFVEGGTGLRVHDRGGHPLREALLDDPDTADTFREWFKENLAEVTACIQCVLDGGDPPRSTQIVRVSKPPRWKDTGGLRGSGWQDRHYCLVA